MITLELSKEEALALFNAATAGVAALSIISTRAITPMGHAALQLAAQSVYALGQNGWSGINDKMLIAMAIEDPSLPAARGTLDF